MVAETRQSFRRVHLAELFYRKGFTEGVEVGVCTGSFSKWLCKKNPKLHLSSIDPYIEVYQDSHTNELGGKYQEDLFTLATKRLQPYNCKLIRKLSMEAVLDFPYESIDFVYIDGSHEFDYIMCDIIEWGRRVKKGGIISGHDYHNARWSAVERAVNIYAQEHQIDKINLCDETAPSWWFERL